MYFLQFLQMDRRWVHGVLFTPWYVGGVKSFMSFVRERFNEDEQILCPCTGCLNHKHLHQNDVERHLLLYGIRSKLCYIGHCRFLPRGHRLRKASDFKSLHGTSERPGTFTREELLEELEKVKDVRVGQKRKRSRNHVPIWGRRVCLWDLPYWPSLKLRNNLDVMHIEKNVCESLLGTILT
jgi:hypothetical protein